MTQKLVLLHRPIALRDGGDPLQKCRNLALGGRARLLRRVERIPADLPVRVAVKEVHAEVGVPAEGLQLEVRCPIPRGLGQVRVEERVESDLSHVRLAAHHGEERLLVQFHRVCEVALESEFAGDTRLLLLGRERQVLADIPDVVIDVGLRRLQPLLRLHPSDEGVGVDHGGGIPVGEGGEDAVRPVLHPQGPRGVAQYRQV
mmetsp:Transcript_117910/g.340843  ORF Transcript_117910/g.340843 Transcript_117910/m.340843 type:complete len:202 (-) Transcript_117910:841-1446(-)